MSEIKIKKSYPQIFLLFLVRWLNRFFVVLSLRKSRKFWGFVYDSVTKQPLDPVIVKLLYAQSGEPAQTCVTDLSGRYGFLAQPGKFKIFAKKSNYLFPSQRIRGGTDGIFTDIYRGEFFELYDESEVVGPNIPMDPIRKDWNQAAKLKILNTYPFLKLFFRRILQIFFWFGFVWAFIFVLRDLFVSYEFKFLGWPQYIFVVYLTLFILNMAVPEFRLWGRVVDLKSGQSLTEVLLELSNPEIQTVILAKAKSQDDGRFLLRANPGKYILHITLNGLSSKIPVKVHGEGVVNLNIGILWINN